MSSELPCKHVQYLLPHPSPFGEGGECEIVRVYFSKACDKEIDVHFRIMYSLCDEI